MIVIADPTLFEIQEMLEIVALNHDLKEILPEVNGMSLAEYCQLGWCYLFYEDDTLEPLGYALFSFEKGRETYPLFLFGTTCFCKPRHLLKARKAMTAVMRNAFKNRVRAYIDSERIAKFARMNGFKPLKRKQKRTKFIWAKVEA